MKDEKRFWIIVLCACCLLLCFVVVGLLPKHQPELIIEQYNEYDLNHDGEVTISDYTIHRLNYLEESEDIRHIILEVEE